MLHRVIDPKNADGMLNSVDPDQRLLLQVVTWPGMCTCSPSNLGQHGFSRPVCPKTSLWYISSTKGVEKITEVGEKAFYQIYSCQSHISIGYQIYMFYKITVQGDMMQFVINYY